MLAITDPRKLRIAVALGLVGVCLLIASWAVRGGYLGSDCADIHRSNDAVLLCVAEQIGTEASITSWLVSVVGVAALIGGVSLASRSVERVMSLGEASEHLRVPVKEVRALIERGQLRPAKETSAKTWLRTEDVLRLGQQS